MPVSFSREDIVSNISWVNITTMVNFMNIIFYFLVFYFTNQSTFFSLLDPSFPLYGGLIIPLMVCVIAGFIFTIDNSETYAFPLCFLNFVNIVCVVINLVFMLNRYSYCWLPQIVDARICSLGNYILLTIAIIWLLFIVVMSMLAIIALIRFSQSIDENTTMRYYVSGALQAAQDEITYTG